MELLYTHQSWPVAIGHSTAEVRQINQSELFVVSKVDLSNANRLGRVGFFSQREDLSITMHQARFEGTDTASRDSLSTYTLPSLVRSFPLVVNSMDKRNARLQEILRLIRKHHRAAINWSLSGPLDEKDRRLLREIQQEFNRAHTARRVKSADKLAPDYRIAGKLNPPATAAMMLWALTRLSEQSEKDSRAPIASRRRSVTAYLLEQAVLVEASTIMKLSSAPFSSGSWAVCHAAMACSKLAPLSFAANYVSNCTEPIDRDLNRRVQQAYATELALWQVSNVLSSIRHGWIEDYKPVMLDLVDSLTNLPGLDSPQARLVGDVILLLNQWCDPRPGQLSRHKSLSSACKAIESMMRNRVTTGSGSAFRLLPDAQHWLPRNHQSILHSVQIPLAS